MGEVASASLKKKQGFRRTVWRKGIKKKEQHEPPHRGRSMICPAWLQYKGLRGVQAGEVGWGQVEEGLRFRQGVWMLLSKQ